MNVILTESIRGLGGPGDEVTVAKGYAENFLIPKGMAVQSNQSSKKIWAEKKKKIVEKEAASRAEAQQIADKLQSSRLIIAMKVGAEDKLYGSVTTKTLEEQVKEQLGLNVEKKNIIMEQPIKSLGEHKIRIELFADVVGELTVEIKPVEE